MTEVVSITLDSGEVMKIPREKSIYGKDNSIDTLVSNCLQEMRKSNNSVLLIKRSVDSEARMEIPGSHRSNERAYTSP